MRRMTTNVHWTHLNGVDCTPVTVKACDRVLGGALAPTKHIEYWMAG